MGPRAGKRLEQMMKNYLAALAIVASAGCGDRVERHTVESIDEVCLVGTDTIRAKFATCLSSSCDTLVSATCSIAREGEDAVVTGRADVDSRGDTCTTDCGFVEATCTGALGDATRVRAGALSVERDELESCSR